MKLYYIILAALGCFASAGCAPDTPPTAASDSIERVAGNWTDRRTGEWTYGFYDDFAIADRNFWEYESVAVTPSRADITLKRGDEARKIVLLLDKAADTLCRAKKGLFGRTPLVRTSSRVAATKKDNRQIEDIPLTVDSVEIEGYLPDAKTGAVVEIEISNIVHNVDTYQAVRARTDSKGRFSAKLPCVGLSELSIICDENRIFEWMKCVPSDKIMLTRDDRSGRLLIMGDYARLYDEESAFAEHRRANDDYPRLNYWDGDSHEEYLDRVRREIYARGKERLADYVAARSRLSRRFRESQESAILSDALSYATQRWFALNGDGADRLPESFTSYIDSVAMSQPRPFRIAWSDPAAYFSARKGFRVAEKRYNSIVEILRYMDENGIRSMSDGESATIETYNAGFDAIIENSLPEEKWPNGFKEAMDGLNALAASDDVRNFIEERGNDFIDEIMNVRMGILDPLEPILSSCLDESLKEMCIANLFMMDLKYHKRSRGELWFATLDKYVTDPVLRYCIDAENERYLALERLDFDNPASIAASAEYASISEAEQLWRSLTEPYEGKVISIDFWGTWCAPCRAELPLMKDIASRYADRDAVFIFLAARSPEESWLNVIRETGLTAPNIVHFNLPDEQMGLLVDKFGVGSYPTHILVDREGNVIKGALGSLLHDDTLETTMGELLK